MFGRGNLYFCLIMFRFVSRFLLAFTLNIKTAKNQFINGSLLLYLVNIKTYGIYHVQLHFVILNSRL